MAFHHKTFLVFGGGCYGTRHIRQLLKARKKGEIEFEKIVVIDQNHQPKAFTYFGSEPAVHFIQSEWLQYGTERLTPEHFTEDDEIVLPCIGPHLFYWWILKRLANEHIPVTPCKVELIDDVPVQIPMDGGFLALSFARWLCPPACIEPDICPAIAQPRTWDLPSHLHHIFQSNLYLHQHLEIFISRHRIGGVASVPVREYFATYTRLKQGIMQKKYSKVYIATVSSCHGLIGCFSVEHSP